MKRILTSLALGAAMLSAHTQEKIDIKIGQRSFVATLEQNEASEQFTQILPLTIKMREFGAKEKTAELRGEFSGDRRAPGYINEGDLMIYGRKSLVLFYKSFEENFYEYIKIAKIDDANGLKEALKGDEVEIKFERITK